MGGGEQSKYELGGMGDLIRTGLSQKTRVSPRARDVEDDRQYGF
uniref:Uncharacterized protein n=1 Tax=Peronospora matthiolae TaxID=2874970 RepID=A0AAV1T5Y5_9STRA